MVIRWLVLWSPATNKILSSIMNEASTITPFISKHLKTKKKKFPTFSASCKTGCGLDNSSQLLDALTRPLPFSQEFYALAGVSFPDILSEQVSELPENLPITIRFPGLSRFMHDPKTGKTTEAYQNPIRLNWETIRVFPRDPVPGPRNAEEREGGHPGYFREGFLGLQSSISEAITRFYNQSTGGRMPPIQVRLQRFPDPAAFNDPDGSLMMLILMLSFNAYLAHVIATVRRIVSEKESHFKEILRILSVDRWMQWAAWFLPALLGFVAISAFMTGVYKVNILGRAVFPFSDAFYLFGVLVVFSVQSVTVSFFISALFSTCKCLLLKSTKKT